MNANVYDPRFFAIFTEYIDSILGLPYVLVHTRRGHAHGVYVVEVDDESSALVKRMIDGELDDDEVEYEM